MWLALGYCDFKWGPCSEVFPISGIGIEHASHPLDAYGRCHIITLNNLSLDQVLLSR